MGWDRQVTEFNDVAGKEYGDPKKWAKFHTDDITCADVKLGEGVITATYSGELIFWKLETGQPYRRYNVMDPKKFIELKLSREEEAKARRSKRFSSQQGARQSHIAPTPLRVANPDYGNNIPISVQAVLFLQTRPMTKAHGMSKTNMIPFGLCNPFFHIFLQAAFSSHWTRATFRCTRTISMAGFSISSMRYIRLAIAFWPWPQIARIASFIPALPLGT